MNFPQLRETFHGDLPSLKEFVSVLVREIGIAARATDKACSQNDATALGDIKHKLRTTLSMLEQEKIADLYTSAIAGVRAGRPIAREQRAILAGLAEAVRKLKAERWG